MGDSVNRIWRQKLSYICKKMSCPNTSVWSPKNSLPFLEQRIYNSITSIVIGVLSMALSCWQIRKEKCHLQCEITNAKWSWCSCIWPSIFYKGVGYLVSSISYVYYMSASSTHLGKFLVIPHISGRWPTCNSRTHWYDYFPLEWLKDFVFAIEMILKLITTGWKCSLQDTQSNLSQDLLGIYRNSEKGCGLWHDTIIGHNTKSTINSYQSRGCFWYYSSKGTNG